MSSAAEHDRLAALYQYGLLDAVRPIVLDDLTRLATRIFDTPMSTVTLVDRNRQWFAGHTGMDANQAPRAISLCAWMIDDPRPLIVPDARLDPRFQDYSNVTGAPYIRFYAGVPLVNSDGYVLGSVCVLDREPRHLGEHQLSLLGDLSAQATGHLEAIREQNRLAVLDAELARLIRREQDLVSTVSHELRTPVTTMQGYLEMLAEEEDLAPYRRMLEPIRRNGDRLVRMVDHLLAGARPDNSPARADGLVDLAAAARSAVDTCEPLAAERGVRVTLTGEEFPAYVVGEAAALSQALEHVVRNAVTFSAGGNEVSVKIAGAKIEVFDQGAGIPAEELPYVFERFYRGRHAQEQAVPGMGLGLSIAWRIVNAHGGRLALDSAGAGRGTRAKILLPAATSD
ncbi:GAF domain-containing sensor histidine kinase [Paractinoplanes durhamensis]|uniref:histidine kinase n=1 Tax=Paractinoplanes durhamensis TaxID=113563 RepID=A0ABQ3ZDQ4_9ACTN|nr:GAF domain-containing sensor histidine kinase [Actinoplanes durhamensis]GIE07982.1 sensor histidine kinase [Actinoplanes durhamensis]